MDLSYQADGRMEMLKQRVKRCVCKYCGKPLSIRRLVFSDIDDARIELYCNQCDRIEFGVEPEIYYSAVYFVDEMEFNYYPELENTEKTRKMNIAKVCDIMSWENKNLGILTKHGFQVPIRVNPNILAECVVLNDTDIDEAENDLKTLICESD